MSQSKFILIVATVLVTLTGYSYAQPGDRPMKKIEQFKKMKLLELLDLDEATANKFLVRYDKWDKDIMQATMDRNDLAAQMKTAMEKKAEDSELNGILDKLVDVTIKIDNDKHDMFKDLRSMLSPRQAVKLAVFEQQFQKRLHESIDKLRERNHDRDHDRNEDPWRE